MMRFDFVLDENLKVYLMEVGSFFVSLIVSDLYLLYVYVRIIKCVCFCKSWSACVKPKLTSTNVINNKLYELLRVDVTLLNFCKKTTKT